MNTTDVGDNSMWLFEPHVAERIFDAWLEEHRIEIVRGALLDREKGVELGPRMPPCWRPVRDRPCRTSTTPRSAACSNPKARCSNWTSDIPSAVRGNQGQEQSCLARDVRRPEFPCSRCGLG